MKRVEPPAAQQIVANGQHRARRAPPSDLYIQVKNQVLADYAKEMRDAHSWRRMWLRLKVAREIRRRLHSMAPDHALYYRA